MVVAHDDGMRKGLSLEKVQKLKPAFDPGEHHRRKRVSDLRRRRRHAADEEERGPARGLQFGTFSPSARLSRPLHHGIGPPAIPEAVGPPACRP